MPSYKRMSLADIIPLALLHATLDEEDKYFYHPCNMSFFPVLKFIWERYHEPNVVAKTDGELLGFAFLRKGELGIVVHPSYRNLGIGHGLMVSLAKKGTILRVNANNYNTMKLYLHSGFSIVGQELDSRMRNLIRMEKK